MSRSRSCPWSCHGHSHCYGRGIADGCGPSQCLGHDNSHGHVRGRGVCCGSVAGCDRGCCPLCGLGLVVIVVVAVMVGVLVTVTVEIMDPVGSDCYVTFMAMVSVTVVVTVVAVVVAVLVAVAVVMVVVMVTITVGCGSNYRNGHDDSHGHGHVYGYSHGKVMIVIDYYCHRGDCVQYHGYGDGNDHKQSCIETVVKSYFQKHRQ